MMRTITSLLFLLAASVAGAQGWYGAGSVSAGNGPDLSASYASLELGRSFGAGMVGAALGRDLASDDHRGLYFAELRGTYTLPLFEDGPQPYLCAGIGQYLDGRWVNEYGGGMSWPGGFSLGACSFGGGGYVTLAYTLMP